MDARQLLAEASGQRDVIAAQRRVADDPVAGGGAGDPAHDIERAPGDRVVGAQPERRRHGDAGAPRRL